MGNTFCKDNNIYVMPCETNLSNIEIYYHLENKIKNTSNIVDTPSTIPNTTFVCVEHPQLTKKQVDENLICSYSGLPSVASYQNKKDKEYVHNIRR